MNMYGTRHAAGGVGREIGEATVKDGIKLGPKLTESVSS